MLAYIIIMLDFIFIVLVSFTLIMKILFVYFHYQFVKKLRVKEAENTKKYNYIFNAYLSAGGAKEIRVNTTQEWCLKRIKEYRNEMLTYQYDAFNKSVKYQILMELCSYIQSFIVLVLLAIRFINDDLSIANFTMYFAAVISLTICLSTLTEQIGNYNKQILNANDFDKILTFTKPKELSEKTSNESIDNFDTILIEFKNVWFKYPYKDNYVLKDVSFKIKNNEKVVIVGMNGAGKTTIIKLLCKFYKPEKGEILINGISIWDIDNNDYYKNIAVVFQDYKNLFFTIKENVVMNNPSNDENIYDILSRLNILDQINKYPQGLDTYISKTFSADGVELSGGQGQKVAIARALYSNTPILILDEPTANLDPQSESEIYQNIFDASLNKTTIFISHRLAASMIADNIIVFNDGCLIEEGRHDALIKNKNKYYEMYKRQSNMYLSKRDIF
jgi:ABC-type multidrug transport system fused ATPase/permease subunit